MTGAGCRVVEASGSVFVAGTVRRRRQLARRLRWLMGKPSEAGEDVVGRQISLSQSYGLLRRLFLQMFTLIHSTTPKPHNGGKTNPARQTVSAAVQVGFCCIGLLSSRNWVGNCGALTANLPVSDIRDQEPGEAHGEQPERSRGDADHTRE
jgi:hypothetical protein